MLLQILKSKIHRCKVTGIEPDYEGSLSIDVTLMKKADIIENEKLLVANMRTGDRFETYAISSNKKGEVCVNGAAAKLCRKGDELIVMAFALMDKKTLKNFKPHIVRVDSNNNPLS